MKTLVQSPLGKFSYLREFHLDVDLTAGQYDLLTTTDSESYTQAVLTILSELMEEDAYKLTYSEMYLLFLLVKCSSVGPKLTVKLECHNKDKSGNVCGSITEHTFGLNEADIKRVPEDYTLPEVELTIYGVTNKYQIRPPTMRQELAILDYFASQGQSTSMLSDYVNHPKLAGLYAKLRMMSFLSLNGESAFPTEQSLVSACDAFTKENKVKAYQALAKGTLEVSSFGVEHKEYVVNCKECGGLIKFRLPLQAGLSL